MSFLSPWSALAAAAIAVPLLLLLYFLKLRRHTTRIASTLLWRRSTEDLQANVPFQRLRWSLLLFLQLLLVTVIVAALGRPVLRARAPAPPRLVLLVDRSASMQALDAGESPERPRSRLDAARAAALEIVDRLGRRSEPSEMMVVAFGATAHVICGFESNRGLLRSAVESIESTDEEADLAPALALAGAFASHDESVDQPPPAVVLVSDGGFADPAVHDVSGGFTLRAGDLRFVGVGPPPGSPVNNMGIAAFSARRDHEDRARVLVFARLVNAGPAEVETALTLRADGRPVAVRTARVPPAGGDGPGEAAVTFSLESPGGAVLTLRAGHRDDLAADNDAALVLLPAAAPRLGLVHTGDEPDQFTYGLLEALQPQTLTVIPAGAPLDPSLLAERFDLVVFDGVPPPRRPPVATLTFGAAPEGIGVRPPGRAGAGRILSWDRQHPILRHVSLDALRYAQFGAYDLPEPWRALASGPDGPVMAVDDSGSVGHVLVGFRLTRSNWPTDVSIAVFMQNVLNELIRPTGIGAALAVRPGDSISVRARLDVTRLTVEGPLEASIDVEPGAEVTLPVLRRAGLYTVRGAVPPMDRIAVNVLSDVESDIRPRRQLVVNARETVAGPVGDAAGLELWPWLAAAAIALLVVEWVVYCTRMRG